MKQVLFVLMLCALLASGGVQLASAQMSAEPAFSTTILPTLGLTEIALHGTAQGFANAPTELAAGRYLVTLSSDAETFSYVDFVQQPTGLGDKAAHDAMLAAARDDVPSEGWVYGGGGYTDPNGSISFAIELKAGDWKIAASHTAAAPDAEEILDLLPLTVTAAPATAAVTEIPATVNVVMKGMAYTGIDGATIKAGPNVWKIANESDQSHHLVMVRAAGPVTTADVMGWYANVMGGTPMPEVAGLNSIIWTGYAALLSPGQSMWEELDLKAGTYVAICYTMDLKTHLPHMMQGMAQVFTVEA